MPELSALRGVNPRLVKVPDAAPPYDCQIHGARCPARCPGQTVAATVDGAPAALAPQLAPPPGGAPSLGAPPGGAPSLGAPSGGAPSLGAPSGGAPSLGAPSLGAPSLGAPSGGAPSGGAADLTSAWPRQLAVVIVEVLAGVRPERQLVALATDRVRARVAGLAPLLACDRRPRITRIVTSRPAARVVEMTVVVNFGPRSRALALRVEHVAARPAAPGWPGRPARWLCTAIEAG